MCFKMADFLLLEPPKFISRKNLSDRDIMKFPHCVINQAIHVLDQTIHVIDQPIHIPDQPIQ